VNKQMRIHADVSRSHARCVDHEAERGLRDPSGTSGDLDPPAARRPCLQRAASRGLRLPVNSGHTRRAMTVGMSCRWLAARAQPTLARGGGAGVRRPRVRQGDWPAERRAEPPPRAIRSGIARGGSVSARPAAAWKLRATSERGAPLQAYRHTADVAMVHRVVKVVELAACQG
jgi:hypothetical protein